MISHLTSDEISRAMIGDVTPEQERHTRECLECAAELERLNETFLLFRESVHEWAGRTEGAAVPADLELEARPSRFSAHPLRWALASAGVIALVALPIYKNEIDRKREAQAVEDRLLLEQVNASLSRAVPESMEPLMNLVSDTSLEGVGNRQ
jgi:anti-sigma factor RsiW